ncbi:MAG: heme-binding domain-containing protein [Aequorivita sp.]
MGSYLSNLSFRKKNNGGFESVASFETETIPTEEVTYPLKQYYCDYHSNQTERLCWNFSSVSWMDNHINHGKKHFNVSIWDEYSIKKKEHKLVELVEMVEYGQMLLKIYSLLHGKYSQADKKLLLQWTGLARLQLKCQLEISIQ